MPLFFVRKIPDCDIPEEMKIYKENTGRKTVKGNEGKKNSFVHSPDQMISATWVEADSGSSIG